MKRGYLKDPTVGGRLLQLSGPQTGKTATLGLLNSLPHGVTNREISAFTEGRFARTIAQQLTAVKLPGEPPAREQEILARLKLGLEQELSAHASPGLEAYGESFAIAFSEQCGQAADLIKKESLEFNRGSAQSSGFSRRGTRRRRGNTI